MEQSHVRTNVVSIPIPYQLTITPEQDQIRAREHKALSDIAAILASSTERIDTQMDEIFNIVAELRLVVPDEELVGAHG